MPVIPSSYSPPFWARQPDILTVYSARVRKVKNVPYQRERIELADGDFIDLDFLTVGHDNGNCILLLHGLEGSSRSRYMLSLADIFTANGFSVCAMNFRGCSGELNRLYGCYHSGKTDDVLQVLIHLTEHKSFTRIMLHGVSLGGNAALKLAGENPGMLPKELKCVMAVSAPVDLSGSSSSLLRRRNRIYERNFNRQLLQKLEQKQQQFPEKNPVDLKSIRTLYDFDGLYTAKAHGFRDAEDYYAKNSALQFLNDIRIPALLLNARNDSFLSEKCYPKDIAHNHPHFSLEVPDFGGHVAFWQPGGIYYNEQRALEFAKQHLK